MLEWNYSHERQKGLCGWEKKALKLTGTRNSICILAQQKVCFQTWFSSILKSEAVKSSPERFEELISCKCESKRFTPSKWLCREAFPLRDHAIWPLSLVNRYSIFPYTKTYNQAFILSFLCDFFKCRPLWHVAVSSKIWITPTNKLFGR